MTSDPEIAIVSDSGLVTCLKEGSCAITAALAVDDSIYSTIEVVVNNTAVPVTDIVLNNDNCPNLIIWGLKDNNSWRDTSNPLLYTAGLSKKPAYFAVRSALRHRVLVNEQTDIPVVPQEVADGNGAIYDLSGRRLHPNSLKPGIYIVNGKKVVIGR